MQMYTIYIFVYAYYHVFQSLPYESTSHLCPGVSFAILSLSKFYVAPRLFAMAIPWYPYSLAVEGHVSHIDIIIINNTW